MPSRNRGHMDKAVFRFIDDNHVSSQWTWYQDGKEAGWKRSLSSESCDLRKSIRFAGSPSILGAQAPVLPVYFRSL
jgi:hypothetical protein